nr:ribonuclease H-like domain-containing protein [Tanacetum cinerariifolium]
VYPIQLSFNKLRKIYKEGDQQVVLEPSRSFGKEKLFSIRVEKYLTHKDYALWEVIINGDSLVLEPLAVGTVVPPKTEAQKLAKKNVLKAKSTMLLAIPDEHLLKFYSIKDAKSLWEAIKTRYGGNKESNKMYKTILKQQYENFVASRSEGLDKTYDSINETVNAAHDILAGGSKEQPSASSYANDVMFSFFASQSNPPQLDNEDLEQIDTDDLEEMDLKWSGDNERRVISVETPASALVVQDGLGGYDRSYHAEERPTDFALIAHSLDSANSSNSEVESCSNECLHVSVNDKTGLGYDSQLSENEMPKCEIFEAASDSSVSEIDEDNNQEKDRTSVNENESIASKSSKEIKEEPKTVRSSAPIIEDWESDSKEECVDKSLTKQDKSSNDNSVKSNECTRKNISENTQLIMMKTLEKDRILGLIGMGKDTDQREVRQVWNNARRVNHQNFSKMTHPHPKRNFVPTAVATKSRHVLVNAAKQSSAASTSTSRPKVNTAAIRPNVNAKSSYFKPHSPKRRHFNQKSPAKTNTFSRKINTSKGNNVTTAGPKAVVNAAEGKKKNAGKSSAC